jgi:hypothetical protein
VSVRSACTGEVHDKYSWHIAIVAEALLRQAIRKVIVIAHLANVQKPTIGGPCVKAPDFRNGSKPVLTILKRDFRNTPTSRHSRRVSACLKGANRRHSISDASPNAPRGSFSAISVSGVSPATLALRFLPLAVTAPADHHWCQFLSQPGGDHAGHE